MNSRAAWHLDEPLCLFGHGQALDHPKDGLTAFGPPSQRGQPRHISIGVIGTTVGIALARHWLARIQRPVVRDDPVNPNQSTFPGFDAAFRCRLDAEPGVEIIVSPDAIEKAMRKADRHQAVFGTVSLFEERIRSHTRNEDTRVAFWMVVVPELIYEHGRPRSSAPRGERLEGDRKLTIRRAQMLRDEPSLFGFENEGAEAHRYDRDFHDQLKGRLLDCGAVLQVVRERTLEDHSARGAPRGMQTPLEIAWNLSTATYYKAGGQPWRLDGIRPGVCYVGMVYKQVDGGKAGDACCGAQMFLHDGDGLVFKGAVGNWYSEEEKEFHLNRSAARSLMEKAVAGYLEKHDRHPAEIFIHGKARFTDEEWRGFGEALPKTVKLVGVRIRRASGAKLFGPGRHPVLRGTAMEMTPRMGHLWTLGYIPRLATYPGREVPNPLLVDVCRGEADLKSVMRDVLALTKVNFNACIYGDGLPVTLRFADQVGDVLTAIPPERATPPLPFRHYI